jgi:hypothetical protein
LTFLARGHRGAASSCRLLRAPPIQSHVRAPRACRRHSRHGTPDLPRTATRTWSGRIAPGAAALPAHFAGAGSPGRNRLPEPHCSFRSSSLRPTRKRCRARHGTRQVGSKAAHQSHISVTVFAGERAIFCPPIFHTSPELFGPIRRHSARTIMTRPLQTKKQRAAEDELEASNTGKVNETSMRKIPPAQRASGEISDHLRDALG